MATHCRISYDIWRVYSEGTWDEEGGECIDLVVHGCFNNGTCVAPNTVRGHKHAHARCSGRNRCACYRTSAFAPTAGKVQIAASQYASSL